RLGAFNVIGIDAGEIDIPGVGRRHEGADQRAIVTPDGVEKACLVGGAGESLANLDVVEGGDAVVIGQQFLGGGSAFGDSEGRVAGELGQRVRALDRGNNVDGVGQ